MEKDLTFLGFVILENKIKKESKPTIEQLNDCDVASIMATGDNILTAISVAKKSSIIGKEEIYVSELKENELQWRSYSNAAGKSVSIDDILELDPSKYCLALSSDCFQFIFDNQRQILKSLLPQAKVFARMSPDQKALLVQ